MRRQLPIFLLLAALASCNDVRRKPAIMAVPDSLPRVVQDTSYASPVPPPADTAAARTIKPPAGFFSVMLPADSLATEHLVLFSPNQTFTLQERYGRDSFSRYAGNWTINEGIIYTYRQQVMVGRYRWDGQQLHYLAPSGKTSRQMMPQPSIASNKVWVERRKKGTLFFGIGNEPFWSVEIPTSDSIIYTQADGNRTFRFRMEGRTATKEGVSLTGTNDSLKIKLHISNYFCSDGMSDYIYPRKVAIEFRNTIFNGCGMIYNNRL